MLLYTSTSARLACKRSFVTCSRCSVGKSRGRRRIWVLGKLPLATLPQQPPPTKDGHGVPKCGGTLATQPSLGDTSSASPEVTARNLSDRHLPSPKVNGCLG